VYSSKSYKFNLTNGACIQELITVCSTCSKSEEFLTTLGLYSRADYCVQ
jgi:hypothetical protein